MNFIIFLSAMLFMLSSEADSHRILGLFIHIGSSHFQTFYPIMNGLAERGHDITVLSYFNTNNVLPNYKEIIFQGLPTINSSLTINTPSRSMYAQIEEFFDLAYLGDITCKDTFKSPALDQIIDEHLRKPFDLIITELFDTDCMLAVVHKMQVPHIGLSSCALMPWHYDRVGLPDSPSFIPSEFLGFTDRMSFSERMISWVSTKLLKLLYRQVIERNDNYLIEQKFGPGIPPVHELAKQVSLIFVNQHFSFSGPRPLSAQVVEIGGIHISEKPKTLPKNLKNILDNAKNGIILISWGSNIKASSISTEKVQSIVKALGRFKEQIIWKWEDEKIPNQPNNVFIQKWIAQREILCHPNVKLFWTHGGNLGLSEAVHCGIPIVGTPIYGDQFLNIAAAVNRMMGLHLPYKQIDEEHIFDKFTEALKPIYMQNAKTVSHAFRHRPMSPLNTSLTWIEYVLSTKGLPVAKSHSVNMTWYAYSSVDVILVLLVAIWVTLKMVLFLLKKCFVRKSVKENKLKIKKN